MILLWSVLEITKFLLWRILPVVTKNRHWVVFYGFVSILTTRSMFAFLALRHRLYVTVQWVSSWILNTVINTIMATNLDNCLLILIIHRSCGIISCDRVGKDVLWYRSLKEQRYFESTVTRLCVRVSIVVVVIFLVEISNDILEQWLFKKWYKINWKTND